MMACTLKYTVFKLLSLVNVVAFESLRPTILAKQKCAPPPPGYATGVRLCVHVRARVENDCWTDYSTL